MATPLDPIDVANQFIGTNNRSIFNDWFYAAKGIATAYCGTFVSYCRSNGGMPLGRIDYMRGFASVPYAVKFYKDKGQITDKPVRNDIVFLNFNGKGNINDPSTWEHTGLFKEDCGDGHNYISIEGNTSNPDIPKSTSQGNGGWVVEKKRPYSCSIFARPNN